TSCVSCSASRPVGTSSPRWTPRPPARPTVRACCARSRSSGWRSWSAGTAAPRSRTRCWGRRGSPSCCSRARSSDACSATLPRPRPSTRTARPRPHVRWSRRTTTSGSTPCRSAFRCCCPTATGCSAARRSGSCRNAGSRTRTRAWPMPAGSTCGRPTGRAGASGAPPCSGRSRRTPGRTTARAATRGPSRAASSFGPGALRPGCSAPRTGAGGSAGRRQRSRRAGPLADPALAVERTNGRYRPGPLRKEDEGLEQTAAPPRAATGRELAERITQELRKRVVGQDAMIERLLIGLLTGGHVLLEGVPGLAKTLTVRSLAETVDVTFHRIQFTPDLLPADVVGTMVYNQRTGEFTPKRGPIFANIVLADEINRAPPKVQSALLEAMQEKQVTIGGETFPLEEPFLVMATQNPIEHEGTYPLPEAQVDRFMLKLKVGYPERSEEREIIRRMAGQELAPLEVVATPAEILAARGEIAALYMDEKLADYIVDLVQATRQPDAYGLAEIAPLIEYG